MSKEDRVALMFSRGKLQKICARQRTTKRHFQMGEVPNMGLLQSLYILIYKEKSSESLQVMFSDYNATKLKITNKRTKIKKLNKIVFDPNNS